MFETLGGGNDRVFAAVSYALAAGQEIELLSTDNQSAASPINLTGNEFDNVIVGNAGNNVLEGGGGVNLLMGLTGDDWYYVRNSSDRVFETFGGGNDRVFAAVSCALAAGQEIELLSTDNQSASSPINLTGNEFDNVIVGNAGNNVLEGGGGVNLLMGLTGDDWYYVRNSSDRVFETFGGGNDRVFAAVSYALAAGQEIELLSTDNQSAASPINLTGNEFDNVIVGNAGNNVLEGGGGVNLLMGLTGDDWYYVRNSSDRVFETFGGGNDRVFAAVSYALAAGQEIEELATVNEAATTAIALTGNEFGNRIVGNAGNNTLNGKGGNDVLVGLGGNDTFVFETILAPGLFDRIEDFGVANDLIQLGRAAFSALPLGLLDPNAFHTGIAAHDLTDRIVYDSAIGALYYDADGAGASAQVQFASLTPGLELNHTVFFLV